MYIAAGSMPNKPNEGKLKTRILPAKASARAQSFLSPTLSPSTATATTTADVATTANIAVTTATAPPRCF